jgi:predicted RNA polymerase sigma factor
MRQGNDFGASEDAVQEALIAAADQWPRRGIPDKPLGWLIRVAGRRLTDHARSEMSRRNREALVGMETPLDIAPAVYDEAESLSDRAETLRDAVEHLLKNRGRREERKRDGNPAWAPCAAG